MPTQIQYTKATDLAFADASIEAIKMWRFEPGQKDGKLTACAMFVPFVFDPYAYSEHRGILSLTKQELEEIQAQVRSRDTFAYESIYDINRENRDVVIVKLKTGSYQALLLYFELRNGKWLENKAKAEEIELLVQ